MDAIKFVNEQTLSLKNKMDFGPGDNVEISYQIIEGAKERVQIFKGDVIQIKGHGLTKSFTVRKISNGKVSTLAGKTGSIIPSTNYVEGSFKDATGSKAKFNFPKGF